MLMVVDGQGGGMGKQLIEGIRQAGLDIHILAVGTNAMATGAMLRAGADQAATGENAVIVGCRQAKLIIGPVGIVMADSLLGEITPAMACAIAQSPAKKVLVPVNQCNHVIVGTNELTLGQLIRAAVEQVAKTL